MIRLETRIELRFLNSRFSSSKLWIRVFRSYPLVEIWRNSSLSSKCFVLPGDWAYLLQRCASDMVYAVVHVINGLTMLYFHPPPSWNTMRLHSQRFLLFRGPLLRGPLKVPMTFDQLSVASFFFAGGGWGKWGILLSWIRGVPRSRSVRLRGVARLRRLGFAGRTSTNSNNDKYNNNHSNNVSNDNSSNDNPSHSCNINNNINRLLASGRFIGELSPSCPAPRPSSCSLQRLKGCVCSKEESSPETQPLDPWMLLVRKDITEPTQDRAWVRRRGVHAEVHVVTGKCCFDVWKTH